MGPRLPRVVQFPPQPAVFHVRPHRCEPRLRDLLAHQSSQPARELRPEDLKKLSGGWAGDQRARMRWSMGDGVRNGKGLRAGL